jgi:hypothetical protein
LHWADLGQETRPVHASAVLSQWWLAVGKHVELAGSALNTNGADGGATAWSLGFDVLDFGPPRSDPLDFTLGDAPGLVRWGDVTAVEDPACSAEVGATNGATRCLAIGPGGAIAVRFTGPIGGVHWDLSGSARVEMVTPDGGFADCLADACVLKMPADEAFVVVGVSRTYNAQNDPACARPVTEKAYLRRLAPTLP